MDLSDQAEIGNDVIAHSPPGLGLLRHFLNSQRSRIPLVIISQPIISTCQRNKNAIIGSE